MKRYWCSIAPKTGPARVVIVEASNKFRAGRKQAAFVLGGDETLIIEIPPGEPEYNLPLNRVLAPEELSAIGAKLLGNVDSELS